MERRGGSGREDLVELPGLPLLCQGMFEPYLKSFYIRSTDPTQIKILKVSDGRRWCGLPAPIPHPVDPQWPPQCLPVSVTEPMAIPARSVCSGIQTNESGGTGREPPLA